MISASKKSIIVVLFPQNTAFRYSYRSSDKKYHKQEELKNILNDLTTSIIPKLIPNSGDRGSGATSNVYDLLYENTTTLVGISKYKASFYFKHCGQGLKCSNQELTKSKDSNKTTTMQYDKKTILTTLDVPATEEFLLPFLEECKLLSFGEDFPEWLYSIDFLNDEKLNKLIDKKEAVIENAKNEIDVANSKLEENMEFKSVLSANGDSLVKVVFKIIEEILNIDLSDFVDINKEDFLFPINDFEFIGEIKGVTSNVRSENIAQLDRHYHSYKDKLSDEGIEKEVKALLIMNTQRKLPPSERKDVHEEQVALAKRNGSLVIETVNLLKIYEKFRSGVISVKNCVGMLRKETGLLTEEVVDKYLNSTDEQSALEEIEFAEIESQEAIKV
jgi:hypothetical protein